MDSDTPPQPPAIVSQAEQVWRAFDSWRQQEHLPWLYCVPVRGDLEAYITPGTYCAIQYTDVKYSVALHYHAVESDFSPLEHVRAGEWDISVSWDF